jgi:hypothetical protein
MATDTATDMDVDIVTVSTGSSAPVDSSSSSSTIAAAAGGSSSSSTEPLTTARDPYTSPPTSPKKPATGSSGKGKAQEDG